MSEGATVTTVKIGEIVPGANPRKTINQKTYEELRDNIRELGILVPLIVRPDVRGYELVAGSRRFKAATELGLENIPVLVREFTDDQVREVQLIENAQREDLDPIDEARAYHELLKLPGYDVDQVAAKVGKSKSYVYQRLSLINLVPPAKVALEKGEILLGHARLLATLQPEDQKAALKDGCHDFRWDGKKHRKIAAPVSALEGWVEDHVLRELTKTCFDIADPTLIDGAGPCSDCPKRSGFTPELFPHVQSTDTCTDPSCFDAKIGTHIRRLTDEHGAIRVTSGWERPGKKDKTLHRDAWQKVAKSKRGECADVQPAVEMDRRAPGFGKLLYACTNKSCKKHWGGASANAASDDAYTRRAKTREKTEQAKRKLEAEWRHRVVRAIREVDQKNLQSNLGEILTAAADTLFQRLRHDDRKLLCAWLDQEAPKKKTSWGAVGRDHDSPIEKWIKDADPLRALAVLAVVPLYSPQPESDKQLRQVAGALGIDHEAIHAGLKTDAAAKAQLKKKSAKKRAAKKATATKKTPAKKPATPRTKKSAAKEKSAR